MYNEVIKKLLRKYEIIPEDLVVMYLMKAYGLSRNMAEQAVFAACRSRAAYKRGDYLMRVPYLDANSTTQKKSLAFRIVIEFLPESDDFETGYSPWLASFIKDGNLIQVCYIERGMELLTSMMVGEKPVPVEDRSSIKRLLIVEPGCDLSKIKKAGFSHICTIDGSYNIAILAHFDDVEEAWRDVPAR